MRLPGYCEKCHRIRQVKVGSAGMAMLAAKRVATGICSACEEAEDDRRRDQRGRR